MLVSITLDLIKNTENKLAEATKNDKKIEMAFLTGYLEGLKNRLIRQLNNN